MPVSGEFHLFRYVFITKFYIDSFLVNISVLNIFNCENKVFPIHTVISFLSS